MSPHKKGFDQRQIILVGLMFAFSVMSYCDRTIMSIAGPQVMREFGIAPTQMGSIYSAFILGYFLLMIPGGQLADRLGPRVTLGLMGLAAALFTGLTALGGKPGRGTYIGVIPAFLVIRICMGVGTAPLYPACGRMGMHWIPSKSGICAESILQPVPRRTCSKRRAVSSNDSIWTGNRSSFIRMG